jgi:hypothetical protein
VVCGLRSGQQLVHREPNVARNLAKECRRDVTPRMEGNGRDATVRMAELLVRTALADFREAGPLEQRDHFTRLENRRFRHRQATRTV